MSELLVVLGEDVLGIVILLRRIEGSRRQAVHVQGIVINVPIDLVSGGEVYAPGLHPLSLEAGSGKFAGIIWQ